MAPRKHAENDWEFLSEPTPAQITEVLQTVPAWHGSPTTMEAYQGYVVSIRQMKGSGQDKYPVWRLYTTVAGKIAILHDAHKDTDGTLTPVEEDVEVEFKGSVVLIRGYMVSPIYGRRFEVGTGVTGDGARGADMTNPIENAMTSWRGRAASALCGAGNLPFTGIASAEEVRTANSRQEMADAGYRVVSTPASAAPEPDPAAEKTKRNTLLQNYEKMAKINKVPEEDVESITAEVLQSMGIEYDGKARDWMVEHVTADVLTKVVARFRERNANG